MDLSCTSFTGFSTSRILRSPSSNFQGKVIPTKVRCISKSYSGCNSSNIFYHSNCSFPISAPPRKTIPLLKGIPDRTEGRTPDSKLTKILQFFDALLQFIKPEVLRGTTAAFTGIMLRTWMENAHLVTLPKSVLLLRGIVVLFAVLCTATNASGINQIFDIEIDKINKPHYPLASGQMSLRSAWILVISSVVSGIVVSVILRSGSFLAFVLSSTFLNCLYSVPPFSTKRSTIGAPLTCALIWVSMTLGLSAAARTILGVPFELSIPITALTIFTSLFILVFGALKDLQDLEGDKKFKVPTLAAIYGPRKIAFFGFGSIVLTYIGAIRMAMLLPQVFKQNIMIPAHVLLALFTIFEAWKLEKANYTKEASQSMFLSIAKLFAIEFVLFPFI